MFMSDAELLDALKAKLGKRTDAELVELLRVAKSVISGARSGRRKLPSYTRVVAYDFLDYDWAKYVLKYAFYDDLKEKSKRYASVGTDEIEAMAACWRAFRDGFLTTPVADQVKKIRAGVPAECLAGISAALKVPRTIVFDLVGLSNAAARRLVLEGGTLSLSASERLMRVAEVEKRAENVFGDEDAAHSWLLEPNPDLGNVSPLSGLDTGLGCQKVMCVLDSVMFEGTA